LCVECIYERKGEGRGKTIINLISEEIKEEEEEEEDKNRVTL